MSDSLNEESASADITICNQKGLHARAAASFVKCAEAFDAKISVRRDAETVSGNSIMDLLMLAAAKGTHLSLSANGPEARSAIAALVELIEAGFHEED